MKQSVLALFFSAIVWRKCFVLRKCFLRQLNKNISENRLLIRQTYFKVEVFKKKFFWEAFAGKRNEDIKQGISVNNSSFER